MIYKAVLTNDANESANKHLLQHYRKGKTQEDLCFALWRPSTGANRTTAIVTEIIHPQKGEHRLHGNASFDAEYLFRSVRQARKQGMGLAFMHSHPVPGWQGMSGPDIDAEQNAIAYPAAVTKLPLLGLTIGCDGYWSARFWIKEDGEMRRHWCGSVQVIEPNHYKIFYNNAIFPPSQKTNILKRTIDSWGNESQQKIARMKIGIVGLGSVGAVVAESLARIGIADIVLIDDDKVEEHNLDRLLHGTRSGIGEYKVSLAKQKIVQNATAEKVTVTALKLSIREERAYKAALDCDFLFSCVDKPLARDVLNHIAKAHLIPVVDGGIAVERDEQTKKLHLANWRAHLVTPYHECMRCNGQYSSDEVNQELHGLLDDPSYIAGLPEEDREKNQNVFPFSLSLASMEVNLMLRYVITNDWWPPVKKLNCQFIDGGVETTSEKCHSKCSINKKTALGDVAPSLCYLTNFDADKDALRCNFVLMFLQRINCCYRWLFSKK